jgi:hypothetical protein
MATGSICIVTPDGIKCMSSPLKAHHHERGCDEVPTAKKLKPGLSEGEVKDFSKKLKNSVHQDVVEKSLLLLLQDDVEFTGALTLVKMPDTSAA